MQQQLNEYTEISAAIDMVALIFDLLYEIMDYKESSGFLHLYMLFSEMPYLSAINIPPCAIYSGVQMVGRLFLLNRRFEPKVHYQMRLCDELSLFPFPYA